jgi:hypothetical protein
MFCPGWGSRNETTLGMRPGFTNDLSEPYAKLPGGWRDRDALEKLVLGSRIALNFVFSCVKSGNRSPRSAYVILARKTTATACAAYRFPQSLLRPAFVRTGSLA